MTKAETLQYLKPRLHLSQVPDFIYFTSHDWQQPDEREKILTKAQKRFRGAQVVVRSSATTEDSQAESQAGVFESVLNIESRDRNAVPKAVNRVLRSYCQKKVSSPLNQIIIQQQETTPKFSGVVFTKDPQTGSPYYLVNYAESGEDTAGITSGTVSSKRLDVYKPDYYLATKPWNRLLSAIREIELVLNNHCLDIEFSITAADKIIIYQARPLLINKQSNLTVKHFSPLIKRLKQSYRAGPMLLSDMAFWNPAEIIGPAPRELAYTFYQELILKRAWNQGLIPLGYTALAKPLITKVGVKPYIDVGLAFQALLPATVTNPLRQKLIRLYGETLIAAPHLHDKIEFRIVDNCFNCHWSERAKELARQGLTPEEVSDLGTHLKLLTNKILRGFPDFYRATDNKLDRLKNSRAKIIGLTGKNTGQILLAIRSLFYHCQNYGVLPFVGAARLAFVAKNIMTSCIAKRDGQVRQALLSAEQSQSVTSDFLNQHLDRRIRGNRFGHLRPGTYDITTPTYHQSGFFSKTTNQTGPKKSFSDKRPIILEDRFLVADLTSLFNSYGLEINGADFICFYHQAIHYRELIKLEFTKNVSLILELIATLGEITDLPKEKLANLDLPLLLKLAPDIKINTLVRLLDKNIKANENYYRQFSNLHYPDLITAVTDLGVIRHPLNQPNYITRQRCTGEIIHLTANQVQTVNLSGKIVAIERADPGFDWIFAQGIKGLVTKYGGVASHMAIRCNELGIPAAIGCGTLLFERIKNGRELCLDCSKQELITI